MVDVVLELYLQTPAIEPQLTNPDEVKSDQWPQGGQGSGPKLYPEQGP
jgi:hypothetical protein